MPSANPRTFTPARARRSVGGALRRGVAWLAGAAALLPVVQAQPTAPASAAVELPEFVLLDTRVANPLPASSYGTPASALRFEPRVDLQSRNFGEAQGDVSVRGGIFEGTAIRLGGLTIFDPQTGHYAAELPTPPAMLGAVEVRTGLDHGFAGANATAGTMAYDWRDITDRAEFSMGVGNGSLNRQSLYIGRVLRPGGEGGSRLAVDAEIARSEAKGTVRHGDHRFFRAAARLQRETGGSRTLFFAGYQQKFFGWPNLYTPFGVAETERLQTSLALLSHEWRGGGRRLELSTYARRNRDDYEFDRFRPGLFNPYQHRTDSGGVAADLDLPLGRWQAMLRGELHADAIKSTSLTAGTFSSRVYGRLAGLVAGALDPVRRHIGMRAGVVLDDTSREVAALSPLCEVSWAPQGEAGTWKAYAQYSGSSRVPGYTALNSPATGGLFRGNPALGRERSRNLELGLQGRGLGWSLHAAAFLRRDDPLVDWTFSRALPNARTANLVEIETAGFEAVLSRTWARVDAVAGYIWLIKDADYRGAPVDASFYALNFPRHRLTLALTARLGGGFEVRSDNEFRVQEKNFLRASGGDRALLSALGLYWLPPRAPASEFALVADNIWASSFQELPSVPAPGRQLTFSVTRRW